jgi:hypothetical protein
MTALQCLGVLVGMMLLAAAVLVVVLNMGALQDEQER